MSLTGDDYFAISNLVADYAFAVDDGDGPTLAALFMPQGVLDVGRVILRGRREIEDFARSVPVTTPGIRHVVSNFSVTGDDQRASGRCYVRAYVLSSIDHGDAAALLVAGRYADEFTHHEGTWLIESRRMIRDATNNFS